MIVTMTDAGYDVIFQPAHGLLAAKLASHWRYETTPRYRLELLIAIAQHDNNQRSFRGGRDKLTDAGAPRGFTVSKGESDVTDLEQPRETLREVFFQGRYAALMVSMHATTLYEGQRGAADELDAFLDEQRENQRRWRRSLGLRKEEAERDYRVMLWCDRASLVLCGDELPSGGRRLEGERTPDGERSWFFRNDDGSVGATPWPFREGEVEVEVEVHRLERLAFDSDEELLDALRASAVEMRSWRLRDA